MLLAVCRKRDIETPERIIPRIARGFAGGVGNTGAVCGAVVGAVMALGLARERGQSMADVLDELRIFGELRRRFEEQMGSIECGVMTGMELGTEEGIEAFMRSDVPERVCMPAVNLAEELVGELLAADAKPA